MATLNKLQQQFCHEYLKLGMNGTQAYLKVYKNVKKEDTASVNASRLLRNAKVKEYIEELQSKAEEKAIVTIEDIVKELTAIAFTDRTKISMMNKKTASLESGKSIDYEDVVFALTASLDEKTKKVIAGYKKGKYGISVETYDKLKALELLGKYLGMFKESNTNVNITIPQQYANLTEEELRKLASDNT